jgi:hypothetical protein
MLNFHICIHKKIIIIFFLDKKELYILNVHHSIRYIPLTSRYVVLVELALKNAISFCLSNIILLS